LEEKDGEGEDIQRVYWKRDQCPDDRREADRSSGEVRQFARGREASLGHSRGCGGVSHLHSGLQGRMRPRSGARFYPAPGFCNVILIAS
jgi:hypothetical protein